MFNHVAKIELLEPLFRITFSNIMLRYQILLDIKYVHLVQITLIFVYSKGE